MVLSDTKDDFKVNFEKAFSEEIQLKKDEQKFKDLQLELFPNK